MEEMTAMIPSFYDPTDFARRTMRSTAGSGRIGLPVTIYAALDQFATARPVNCWRLSVF
jgi:hypothetical protein